MYNTIKKHYESDESSTENAISSKLISCGHYAKNYNYVNRLSIIDNVLIYCIGGEGILECGGIIYSIKSGDIIYIPAKTAHKYYPKKDNIWNIYWTHFRGEVSYFNKGFKGNFFHFGESYDLINCFDNLLQNQEVVFFDELSYLASSSWINTILYKILDKINKNNKKSIVGIIQDYMLKNINSPFSLDDLSSSLGFSKHHLCREFKKHTGESIVKQFNRMKILKACEYLCYTNMNISEVSELLGFNNQFYFTTVFKNVMGYPPSKIKEHIN